MDPEKVKEITSMVKDDEETKVKISEFPEVLGVIVGNTPCANSNSIRASILVYDIVNPGTRGIDHGYNVDDGHLIDVPTRYIPQSGYTDATYVQDTQMKVPSSMMVFLPDNSRGRNHSEPGTLVKMHGLKFENKDTTRGSYSNYGINWYKDDPVATHLSMRQIITSRPSRIIVDQKTNVWSAAFCVGQESGLDAVRNGSENFQYAVISSVLYETGEISDDFRQNDFFSFRLEYVNVIDGVSTSIFVENSRIFLNVFSKAFDIHDHELAVKLGPMLLQSCPMVFEGEFKNLKACEENSYLSYLNVKSISVDIKEMVTRRCGKKISRGFARKKIGKLTPWAFSGATRQVVLLSTCKTEEHVKFFFSSDKFSFFMVSDANVGDLKEGETDYDKAFDRVERQHYNYAVYAVRDI